MFYGWMRLHSQLTPHMGSRGLPTPGGGVLRSKTQGKADPMLRQHTFSLPQSKASCSQTSNTREVSYGLFCALDLANLNGYRFYKLILNGFSQILDYSQVIPQKSTQNGGHLGYFLVCFLWKSHGEYESNRSR